MTLVNCSVSKSVSLCSIFIILGHKMPWKSHVILVHVTLSAAYLALGHRWYWSMWPNNYRGQWGVRETSSWSDARTTTAAPLDMEEWQQSFEPFFNVSPHYFQPVRVWASPPCGEKWIQSFVFTSLFSLVDQLSIAFMSYCRSVKTIEVLKHTNCMKQNRMKQQQI